MGAHARKARRLTDSAPVLNLEESSERIKALKAAGYRVKKVRLPNGDVAVLRERTPQN